MEHPDLPFVSVVIVTKNNRAEAENAVRSVLNCGYPTAKREIVIIEETDSARPITGEGVVYISIPQRNLGVGYARNFSLHHCRGEMIAFTDDDCIVDRLWLEEIVKPLQRDGYIASAGAVLVPDCGPVGKCESILGFPGGGVKYLHRSGGNPMEMATFSTCSCAISRPAAGDLLHFRTGLTYAGEDELLSRSISALKPILYIPDAVVRHKPRDSFYRVFKWFLRRGLARVEVLRYAKSPWGAIRDALVTSLLLRLLFAAAIAGLFHLPFIPFFSGLFMVYYFSVIWRYRWGWKYYPAFQVMTLLPLVKTTMDLGMDIGVLKALLYRKQVRK